MNVYVVHATVSCNEDWCARKKGWILILEGRQTQVLETLK